jgi:hypothetical protein
MSETSSYRSECAALVVAPSPLAGEGITEFQQWMMGEGLRTFDKLEPLTHRSSLKCIHALSRRGRGRIRERCCALRGPYRVPQP